MTAPKRKHIALSEKLATALADLMPKGMRDDLRHRKVPASDIIAMYEFDHIILHAHGGADKWWNLTAMAKVIHREKSRKDTSIVAKTKRLGKTHTEHKRFMENMGQVGDELERATGAKPKLFRWPTRKLPSRPFPKAHRPMRRK